MNENTIGQKLKEARLQSSVSVKEISDLLISKGFKASPNTIYSWENGNSQPTPDALLLMCQKYGIKDVLQYFDYEKRSTRDIDLPQSELEHIKKYRSLTDNGRKAVDAVTEVLYEAERATEPDNIIRINVRRLPLYTIGASAGCGNPLDDSPYDIVEIGPEAPIQTSFLLKADGDSMEPLIQNGETLYIKQQDHIEDGEIGIFWFDGDVFVKKQEHRHGGLYLVSLNPKYKPIKIIDDSIHCFGKVLNK